MEFKRSLTLFFISIFVLSSSSVSGEFGKKEASMVRRALNAGSFYPSNCSDIEKSIGEFNGILDSLPAFGGLEGISTRAVISPHAGYIYSGFTANSVHRLLGKGDFSRVIVVGPSHHHYFEGISVSLHDQYESPCGNIPIDREYARTLAKKFSLHFMEKVHSVEHSTETQIPFIGYYEPKAEVVEIIYGKCSYMELAEILKYILSDSRNAVVISSDLSHFHSLERAKKIDSLCLAGVAQESVDILENGCEACGIIGMEAIVTVAREMGWKSRLVDYRTSADASGDTTRVVGYLGALFQERPE